MTNEPTYGAARARLIENGYVPAALGAPDGAPWLFSEFPVAVWTGSIAALVLVTSDRDLRAKVNAVVDRLLGKGPTRTGSDGSELRVFRCDHVLLGRAWGPQETVVQLVSQSKAMPGAPLQSALLPISGGTWRNGDLLKLPRAKLPPLTAEAVEQLFSEMYALTPAPAPTPWVPGGVRDRIAGEWEPPPIVTRPRLVGARSLHQMKGQPAVLAAHLAAVKAGEEEPLPATVEGDFGHSPPKSEDDSESRGLLGGRMFGL